MKAYKKVSILVLSFIILLTFSSCNDKSTVTNTQTVLDKTNIKQFNMFFSNFSEVDLLPFTSDTLQDRKLIIFSIKHILLNEPEKIQASDAKDSSGKISAKVVEDTAYKYFGKKITEHGTVLVGQYGDSKDIVPRYTTYTNGYYIIPTAYNNRSSIVFGESRSFSITNNMTDNKDGTLTADISIYSIKEDNIHFKDDQFTTTPEDWSKSTAPEWRPTFVGNMTAKIKKEPDGRYILIEYNTK